MTVDAFAASSDQDQTQQNKQSNLQSTPSAMLKYYRRKTAT